MIAAVIAAQASGGLRVGLLVTAFGFGFRHGIDWDHIAAITDIVGSEVTPRRSLRLATLYALGHAAVVLALGAAAVTLAAQLPPGVDVAMERLVGVTLLALGVYVVVGLARDRDGFRMRSRWMLVLAAARRAALWLSNRRAPEVVVIEHDHEHGADEAHALEGHRAVVAAESGASTGAAPAPHQHRHRHTHVVVAPADPFVRYRARTAVLVGMIHGIGAETPSQVLIFLAAAGAGGKPAGMALLGLFIAGLLLSNTAVAVAATFGFGQADRSRGLYLGVSALTAAFSLVVGALFVLGRGSILPTIFGG